MIVRVVAMPGQSGGLIVHAALIPDRGVTAPEDEKDRLRQAIVNANAKQAPHQRVSDFTVWDGGDFPRTNLGKIKRFQVRAKLLEETPAVPAAPVTSGATSNGLDRLKIILGDITHRDPTNITRQTDLTLDLQMDSLSRVELCMQLEQELGAVVREDDLAAVKTVSELSELLESSEPAGQERISFPRWSLRRTPALTRRLLQQAIVFPLHSLAYSPFKVSGLENLTPLRPPVLFIANHCSHADTPSVSRALPARLRNKLAVAAAADYFYSNKAFGLNMTLILNTFPFHREGPVRSSLEYCGELMDNGWSLLVYPEGTRSLTGRMQEFRSGVGLLAVELGAPIVPIAISGTYAVFPKGSRFPHSGPITVRFGEPLKLQPSCNYDVAIASLQDRLEVMLK